MIETKLLRDISLKSLVLDIAVFRLIAPVYFVLVNKRKRLQGTMSKTHNNLNPRKVCQDKLVFGLRS